MSRRSCLWGVAIQVGFWLSGCAAEPSGQLDSKWPSGGKDPAVLLDLVPGCNPFATSAECLLPYPSRFFEVEDPRSGTGVRLSYPADALLLGDGKQKLDMAPFNRADGVSPAGPILIHFGRDVHPERHSGRHLSSQAIDSRQSGPCRLTNAIRPDLVRHCAAGTRQLRL